MVGLLFDKHYNEVKGEVIIQILKTSNISYIVTKAGISHHQFPRRDKEIVDVWLYFQFNRYWLLYSPGNERNHFVELTNNMSVTLSHILFRFRYISDSNYL